MHDDAMGAVSTPTTTPTPSLRRLLSPASAETGPARAELIHDSAFGDPAAGIRSGDRARRFLSYRFSGYVVSLVLPEPGDPTSRCRGQIEDAQLPESPPRAAIWADDSTEVTNTGSYGEFLLTGNEAEALRQFCVRTRDAEFICSIPHVSA